MPKGSTVDRQYEAMRSDGMDAGKAARIAQANTGLSLATGKPPSRKRAPADPKKESISAFMKRRNAKVKTKNMDMGGM